MDAGGDGGGGAGGAGAADGAAGPDPCEPIAGQAYESTPTVGPPTDRPPAMHGD